VIRVQVAGLVVAAAAVAVGLAGCVGDPSARATWTVIGEVTPASESIEIGVMRADCANGVTGELLDPVVTSDENRITIQARAAPNGLTGADCPQNDVVTQTVELGEPVGDREIFDAICLDPTMSDYSWCRDDGGVRWPKPE
jgi:hypothetical protein